MRRLVVLILLLVGASACGRSEAEEERAFRAQANGLCAAYVADVRAQRLPTTREGLEELGRRLIAREKRLFAQLGELEAPPRLRERFERAVRAGSQTRAHDDLLALGLGAPCVTVGLPAEPGGIEAAEVAEPICAGGLRELQRDLEEEPQARRPAAVADELRSLVKQLELEVVPPRRTTKLWSTAVAEMAQTARLLSRAARATDDLEQGALATEVEASLSRGTAAWTLINVDACSDLYRVLNGLEPS